MRRLFLFLGKGGVGKTTSSASLSFWLAERDYRVLWVSVDPAHNIRDIVGRKLAGVQKVYRGLYAVEVDVDAYVASYIEESIKRMERMYRHLSIVGLEGVIRAMRHSPGMEEVAILYALEELLRDADPFDYVVVDTPPTGLTLRILAIPKLNMEWLNVLRMWRLKILERRSMVASVRGRDAFPENVALGAEDDMVLAEIKKHMDRMRGMMELFAGPSCVRVLVVNQDALSVREGERIVDGLRELGMGVDLVLVNKFGMLPHSKGNLSETLKGLDKVELPLIEGKASLEREDYLKIAERWAERVIS